MIRKSVIACTALALLLAGCGQPTPKESQPSQNEAQQEVQDFANVQEFLETLELTDVVTITDEENCTVVLGTLDEAGEEQMDAYWRQVINTDPAAQMRDATISSTLEFTEGDQKVKLTLISDLELYLEECTEISKDELKSQNFCYSIEKI